MPADDSADRSQPPMTVLEAGTTRPRGNEKRSHVAGPYSPRVEGDRPFTPCNRVKDGLKGMSTKAPTRLATR